MHMRFLLISYTRVSFIYKYKISNSCVQMDEGSIYYTKYKALLTTV